MLVEPAAHVHTMKLEYSMLSVLSINTRRILRKPGNATRPAKRLAAKRMAVKP